MSSLRKYLYPYSTKQTFLYSLTDSQPHVNLLYICNDLLHNVLICPQQNAELSQTV